MKCKAGGRTGNYNDMLNQGSTCHSKDRSGQVREGHGRAGQGTDRPGNAVEGHARDLQERTVQWGRELHGMGWKGMAI